MYLKTTEKLFIIFMLCKLKDEYNAPAARMFTVKLFLMYKN